MPRSSAVKMLHRVNQRLVILSAQQQNISHPTATNHVVSSTANDITPRKIGERLLRRAQPFLNLHSVHRDASHFLDKVTDNLIGKEKSALDAWNMTKQAQIKFNNGVFDQYKSLALLATWPFFTATTRMTYLKKARQLRPQDFANIRHVVWCRTLKELKRQYLKNRFLKGKKCVPATPTLLLLILPHHRPLTMEFHLVLFRCWVLGCRHGDLKYFTSKYLPKYRVAAMASIGEKGKDYVWVRFVPCCWEQYKRVWNTRMWNHEQKFKDKYYAWLISQPGRLTLHSCRNGVVHFLQQNFPVVKTVLVTGHGSALPPVLTAYMDPKPTDHDAAQQMRMLTALIKAVRPDMKY